MTVQLTRLQGGGLRWDTFFLSLIVSKSDRKATSHSSGGKGCKEIGVGAQ